MKDARENSVSHTDIYIYILFLFISLCHVLYPKWTKSNAEATIGWDVTGYYMYLPAVFIYKDITMLDWAPTIIEKYKCTPDFQQAFSHWSGRKVFKYSSGLAIQYLPGFLLAHSYCKITNAYPADGFSGPYQVGIALNGLLFCLLGLILLNKALIYYFTPVISSVTLSVLVLASNYLNYSAIDGAMTHNYLFTVYAFLLWCTIQFYEKPSWKYALGIGGSIGLAALTRPTEILSCILPLLWGLKSLKYQAITEHFKALWAKKLYLIGAAILCFGIGCVQLIYWKLVAHEWIVYSYEDQGFSWLRPHLWNGIFSYHNGWLVYSPVMVLSLIGLIVMLLQDNVYKWAVVVFAIAFIYVAFAWDIWWYGGSLGQRTMVQAYPVLALPMAALIQTIWQRKWILGVVSIFIGACIYMNLWWTYQAHLGKYYYGDLINKTYYWEVLGRWNFNPDYLKILDTNEYLDKQVKSSEVLHTEDFEQMESANNFGLASIRGLRSYGLDASIQSIPEFTIKQVDGKFDWYRLSAQFYCDSKEWDTWRQAQYYISFMNGKEKLKTTILRVPRLLEPGRMDLISFEAKAPDAKFDAITIGIWNGGSNTRILVDDLKVEGLKL